MRGDHRGSRRPPGGQAVPPLPGAPGRRGVDGAPAAGAGLRRPLPPPRLLAAPRAPAGSRGRARLPWPRAMKLVIQIPCLNEEATLPHVLVELPRDGRRLRRGRVADHRRRLQRSDGRGRAGRRGGPRRQADEQQGPCRRLPGGDRRRPEAGRGRDRQHGRRPPIPARPTSRSSSRRSWPGAPTWWSATGRSRTSSTSPPRRRPSSGSEAGSCDAPRAPASPTRPPAFAPTTGRRRSSSRSSPTTPTRSRA